MYEAKTLIMTVFLSDARVSCTMHKPSNFLNVDFRYDPDGVFSLTEFSIELVKKGVDTKGKTYVTVRDSRGVFSGKSGVALLDVFRPGGIQ